MCKLRADNYFGEQACSPKYYLHASLLSCACRASLCRSFCRSFLSYFPKCGAPVRSAMRLQSKLLQKLALQAQRAPHRSPPQELRHSCADEVNDSPQRAGTVAGRIAAADHPVWRQHHRACLGPLRLGSRAHSGIYPARRRHQPRVFWLQLGGGMVSGCRGTTVLPAPARPWTAPVMRLKGVYAGPC